MGNNKEEKGAIADSIVRGVLQIKIALPAYSVREVTIGLTKEAFDLCINDIGGELNQNNKFNLYRGEHESSINFKVVE